MEIPGQTGWSVTGDKTVEFAKTPLDFVENRMKKYQSRVFLSRVLNKPHIFVTSSKGVKEILIGKEILSCENFCIVKVFVLLILYYVTVVFLRIRCQLLFSRNFSCIEKFCKIHMNNLRRCPSLVMLLSYRLQLY